MIYYIILFSSPFFPTRYDIASIDAFCHLYGLRNANLKGAFSVLQT